MTYHQLTQEERYLIAAQRMCGCSPAQMARVLGRHRSTVTREVRRNATHHDGDYRAEKAHSYAVPVVGAVVAEPVSAPPTWPEWRC